MTRLTARLEQLDPGAIRPMIDQSVVASTRGKSLGDGDVGWIVVVGADGKASLSGDRDAKSSLADTITAQRERARDDRTEQPIYLAAAGTTPVAALAKAAAEARGAGLRGELRLLVSVAVPAPTPGDSRLFATPSVAALRKQLENARASGKAEAIVVADALRTAIAPCTPIVQLFGEMAAAEASEKAVMLVKVPAAAQSCDCQMADVDVLEFSMLALLGAFDVRIGWLPAPPLAAGDRRNLAELIPN